MREWHQRAIALAQPVGLPTNKDLVGLFDRSRRRFRAALVVYPTVDVVKGVTAAWKLAIDAHWFDGISKGGKKCNMKGATRSEARSLARATLGDVGEGPIRFRVVGQVLFCSRNLKEEETDGLSLEFFSDAVPVDEEWEWAETPSGEVVEI